MIGRVKWFDNDAGYGFLDYKEDEDIFVHYSAILGSGYKTLEVDQLVEFTLVETGKGLQAVDVKLVKETATAK